MITVISKYIVRPSSSNKCRGNFILGHRRAAQIDQFHLMLGLALYTTEYFFKIPGSMSSCPLYGPIACPYPAPGAVRLGSLWRVLCLRKGPFKPFVEITFASVSRDLPSLVPR